MLDTIYLVVGFCTVIHGIILDVIPQCVAWLWRIINRDEKFKIKTPVMRMSEGWASIYLGINLLLSAPLLGGIASVVLEDTKSIIEFLSFTRYLGMGVTWVGLAAASTVTLVYSLRFMLDVAKGLRYSSNTGKLDEVEQLKVRLKQLENKNQEV